MTRGTARRRPAAVVLSLLLPLLVLGGCVSVPTSGPIDKVEGSQPTCENCVNVEVPPPAVGDNPLTIVRNYLRANANYQPGYAVARQYLSRAAATKWNPDDSVTIYSDPVLTAEEDVVTLSGAQVGFLSGQRTFSDRPLDLQLELKVVSEGGEWRIDNPLAGLMVAQSSFETLYKPYDVFFLGTAGSLVPQSIYLPNLRNPDNVASALVKTLLEGPSRWLAPAVSTAVPPETTLSGEAVTIVDGVARVPLSPQVQQLAAPARSQLTAQLVYTLQQVTGVKKVLLLADNQPLQVPESEQGDLAVPVEDVPAGLDPIPFVSSEQLFAVRGGRLATVSANADTSELTRVKGPLGDGTQPVESMAVSLTGSSLAAVTDDRTVLRLGAPGATSPAKVLDGVTKLLRPQFSRDDQLWAVADQDGRQQMWILTPTARTPVQVPSLVANRLVAFRLSPDGARMAMLLEHNGTTRLGLARVIRSAAGTTVNSWRELRTTPAASASSTAAPPVAGTVMRDVAWTDATNLMVLRQQSGIGPFLPVRVSDDASRAIPDVQDREWDPFQLTVLLRTKTALLVSRDGQVYRDDGTMWESFLTRVSAVASPG